MKRKTRLLVAFAVAFLCCLHSVLSGQLYFSSDNFDISLILNGYYSTPLSQYQHPLLCFILHAFSMILPFADSFMLAIHIGVFFELVVFFYIMANRPMRKSLSKWLLMDYLCFSLALLSVVILSTGFKVWYVNYTITTASFVAIGIMILAKAKAKRKSYWWIIIGTGFISLGFMFRKESALLFVPFAVLIAVTDYLSAKDRKEEMKSLKRYVLPTSMIVCLLFGIQMIINAIEPFSSADRYNKARTAVVDYPMQSWNTISNQDKVSKNDYNAAINWLFCDTEIMNTDLIEKIAEVGSKKEYEYSWNGFRKALSEMWKKAGKTDVYISLVLLLIFMMTIRNILSERSIWRIMASILAVVGGFIILLYYTFAGRAPLRIWEPVLFAMVTTEILIMTNGRSRWPATAHTVFLLIISVVLYYGAGQVIAHTEFKTPQLAINSKFNTFEEPYGFSEDSLYIWPNWHATIPEYAEKTGKLPSQNVINHNIALGDWTSGQPYYTGFLKRIGHENPIRDLVEMDNVYIMSNDDYIMDFLRKHYGDNINLAKTGEINGVVAYRVDKTQSYDAQEVAD